MLVYYGSVMASGAYWDVGFTGNMVASLATVALGSDFLYHFFKSLSHERMEILGRLRLPLRKFL